MTTTCETCGHSHEHPECPVCGEPTDPDEPTDEVALEPLVPYPVVVLYAVGGGFLLFWILMFALFK